MKLNLVLNRFFLEMSIQCECLDPILTSTFLPLPLVNIVQGYLHSRVKEKFYKSVYANFHFRVRLNKEIDTIEDLKTGCILGSTPILLARNSFLIDIVEKKDANGNISQWINLNFVVGSTSHFFSTCLTADIVCAINARIPVAKNRYRIMHKNLVKYFDEGNKDVLLTEIIQECQVVPIQEDYERIWDFLNNKIAAWMLPIDFWGEIHR